LSSILFGTSNSLLAQVDTASYSTSASLQRKDRAEFRNELINSPLTDIYASIERPILNGLYKSIPAERAEQLLGYGVNMEEAVNTAIQEYLEMLPDDEKQLTLKAQVDGYDDTEIVIDGTPAGDNIDVSMYNNSTIIVNALAGNDTVIVGGSNNNVTVNLDDGNDLVQIDGTNYNEVFVDGGAGNDRLRLSGVEADWNFDEIDTYTHNTSGAIVTVVDIEIVQYG
jgi:Ca2+-binding RTX toxin-like protein